MLLVVVLRAGAPHPVPSAAVVAALALAAVVGGLSLHGGDHLPSWRRAWRYLGAGLVVLTIGSVARAAAGGGVAWSPLDALTLAGDALAATGLVLLLRERMPGRAIDAVFEGVLVAACATFVPWSASMAAGVPARDVLVLVLPAAHVILIWLLVRLVALSRDHPVAYRYVGAGFVCLLTVYAVAAGSVLGATHVGRDGLTALELWGFCLWGAGALHPSLRRSFDPVAGRAPRLSPAELMALLTVSLFPAAVFGVQAARGYPPSLATALLGATGMPMLAAIYLVRQVHDPGGGPSCVRAASRASWCRDRPRTRRSPP